MSNPIDSTERRALATLVATDGSEAAQAAVRIAASLTAEGRIVPQVIVVDPMPIPKMAGVSLDSGPVYSRGDADELAAHRTELREMLSTVGAGDWQLRVRTGEPPEEILRDAERGEFELLMLGLRPHNPIDRLSRRETTLQIMKHSRTPIFAVAYWLHRTPRRIVVGLDFSRSSVRAAEMSCRILADHGTIVLAHGDYHFGPAYEEIEGLARVYERGMQAELTSLIERLPLPNGARVETAALAGASAPALLELAERESADAIAVGRQHHPGINRLLIGSVAADLVRDARCSVLVTPLIS